MIDEKEILLQLKKMGLGDKLAERVAEEFGYDNVITIVKNNPYDLMQIDGISFLKADKISRNYFSIGLDDERRQSALIYYLLDNQKNLGHTYLPFTILEKEMKKQAISNTKALETAISKGDLVVEENRVYTRRMYEAEVGSATYIKQRLHQ